MRTVEQCDVLVAGGGSAGVAAAVAAARCGAKTILVERHGSLGGMSPAAFVHSICGLYLLRVESGTVYANPGFASEFAGRLLASGGASGPVRMGRVDVLMHHPTAFARLCDEMVSETGNLELRLHTEISGAGDGPVVGAVETVCRGLPFEIEPRAVVDASGDAALAALAGAEFEMEDSSRLQRPAFIFTLQGVDPAALDEAGRLKIVLRVVAAVREGRLPAGALGMVLRAAGQDGGAFVTIDLEGPPNGAYDPTDSACLTRLEIHGRQLAVAVAGFLHTGVDGFRGSSIAAFPACVGIRESRRITGQSRLEADDLLRGARFDDEIALATWPMELREQATGPRLRFPENGRPCGIPLSVLRSKTRENLFMAGRCISASHEAQASVRVIGTCLATGEAAGIAAALLAAGEQCDSQAVRAARERTGVHEHR